MTLNIFIVWSGRTSSLVARKLATWFKEVIPQVNPLMSELVPEWIGTESLAWFGDLNTVLRRANFAVLCVSPENWNSPWISYEAGVILGKTNKETRVRSYVIDPEARRRNLPEPLKFFWAEMADYDGTFRLVKIINQAAGSPLSGPALEESFKSNWPGLKEVLDQVAEKLRQSQQSPPTPTPEPDVKDDFMRVSRRIEMHQDRLFGHFYELIYKAVRAVRAGTYDREAFAALAVEEIEKSRDRFKTDRSLLVDNVYDFFGRHYTEAKLRQVISEMDSALRHDWMEQPPSFEELAALLENWTTRMKRGVLEVFLEYHRILLSKLNDYLNRDG
jgi:hypothetical protein